MLGLWVLFLSFAGTWLAMWMWERSHPCPCATSVGPMPSLPETSPTRPVFPYIVQPGESLQDVARQFGVPEPTLKALNRLVRPTLQPGQMLLIPGTPPVTATNPAEIRIQKVEHPGLLREERIQLVNLGPLPVNLQGWRLLDEDGHIFTFPAVVLYPRGGLWVWTRAGTNSPVALFWGLQEPLLRPGETLILQDAQGQLRDTYTVP